MYKKKTFSDVIIFWLMCFFSFPSVRTFYQLSSSVQAEEEALLYQETKSKLNFSHIPLTPLLPACFFWNDPRTS